MTSVASAGPAAVNTRPLAEQGPGWGSGQRACASLLWPEPCTGQVALASEGPFAAGLGLWHRALVGVRAEGRGDSPALRRCRGLADGPQDLNCPQRRAEKPLRQAGVALSSSRTRWAFLHILVTLPWTPLKSRPFLTLAWVPPVWICLRLFLGPWSPKASLSCCVSFCPHVPWGVSPLRAGLRLPCPPQSPTPRAVPGPHEHHGRAVSSDRYGNRLAGNSPAKLNMSCLHDISVLSPVCVPPTRATVPVGRHLNEHTPRQADGSSSPATVKIFR